MKPWHEFDTFSLQFSVYIFHRIGNTRVSCFPTEHSLVVIALRCAFSNVLNYTRQWENVANGNSTEKEPLVFCLMWFLWINLIHGSGAVDTPANLTRRKKCVFLSVPWRKLDAKSEIRVFTWNASKSRGKRCTHFLYHRRSGFESFLYRQDY